MRGVADAERTLQALLDVYSGAGFIVDDDGRYLEILEGNREGGLLYDDPDSLRGRRFHDVLPAATADRFLDTVESVLETGESQRIEYDLEVAAGRRWFEAAVSPLRPLDEPPEAVVWVARDITEHKEQKRRLSDQTEKIAALHDVATDIETCETPADVYDLVVEAAEAILEFDIAIADEAEDDVLVPRAVSSHLSSDQYYEETPVDAEDNLAAEAFRTGEPSLVTDLRTHDVAPADPTFRSALTVPIGDHGVFQSVAETPDAFDERDLELVEMLVAHARARLSQLDRERQLRERTEALRRQNERLDEFASIVSHDLRTPLGVARGHLELAREEADSDHHGKVADALDRMDRMVDDLLTLAREGDQVGEIEPVELPDVVESCWDDVAPEGATLSVETDLTVEADPERLQQLLDNLLGNAVEHGSTSPQQAADAADHGGEAVTATVGDLDDGAGFYVADDGPGIPEGERDRVFDSAYSTADDGTGFGLTIVRAIAEAHGWDVEVTESEAGGARFEVTGVDAVAP